MPKDMNIKEFQEILQRNASHVPDALEKAIKSCCKKVQDDIWVSMAKTQVDSSKSYYKNNARIAHHPSLPGHPPAVDTGNLRESINYEVHNEKKEVYGIVGSTQKDPDYAVWMEYGTSRIAPRPWLSPAMQKNNTFIRTQLKNAVERTMKEGVD